jgi:hypothetical protein
MATNLNTGTFGEQNAGFFLGAQGYFLVEGPSGTQGHAANAPGFDGVAYNIARDDLIIYDNKTFKSTGNVGSGTAIDPAANLTRNLDALIARIQTIPDLPRRSRILDLLQRTRMTLTPTSVNPPPNVRIAITNFGGNSPGVTAGFISRGVTFIDMNRAPAVPAAAARVYLTKETVLSFATPAGDRTAAYNDRLSRAGAYAEAVRAGSQSANDISLNFAIEQELSRLMESINDALVRGGGALVVINIEASSPSGNVGMVVARSVNSSYVIPEPSADMAQALFKFDNGDKLRSGFQAHRTIQTRLLWIAVPGE